MGNHYKELRVEGQRWTYGDMGLVVGVIVRVSWVGLSLGFGRAWRGLGFGG